MTFLLSAAKSLLNELESSFKASTLACKRCIELSMMTLHSHCLLLNEFKLFIHKIKKKLMLSEKAHVKLVAHSAKL